ncbi:MAG: SGNH/GDSL hydrolase family protein [Ignavibacteriaceae bacterium]
MILNKKAVKFHKLLIFVTIFFLISLSGCKEEKENNITDPPVVINTGSADFSSFVVVGNSVTAGFQSNALYQTAQEFSFGKLIAGQVNTGFEQPLISDPGTGGRIEMESIFPLKLRLNTNTGSELSSAYAGSFNNLGVPGAYTYDIVNAYNKETSYSAIGGGSGNDFINIVLRGKGTQFQQVKALDPTLLVLWIGNNDILGHASSGGVFPATPIASFESFYRQMADSVASLGTEVIVGNVFDVTTIPYFTTMGLQFQLNGTDSVWGITGTGDTLLLDLNKNFITLRAAAEEVYDIEGNPTARGMSRSFPIRNQYILDEAEIKNTAENVDKYNEIIASLALQKGFTLVDFNLFFKTIKSAERLGGYVIDGQKFTTLYYFGNLFSLDGVHPSNQGQAILANEIIKAINLKYNAEIPEIRISEILNNFISEKIAKSGKSGIPLFPKDTFKYLPF